MCVCFKSPLGSIRLHEVSQNLHLQRVTSQLPSIMFNRNSMETSRTIHLQLFHFPASYVSLFEHRLQQSRVLKLGIFVCLMAEQLNCDHPSPNSIEVVRSIQRTSATRPGLEAAAKCQMGGGKSCLVVYLFIAPNCKSA